MVLGSDAKPYVSVADSTGIDPTADTTESSWSLFEAQGPPGEAGPAGSDANVPLASTSEAGKVELATGGETLNRTDAGKAVTPGALADSVLTAEPTDNTEDNKLLTWGVAKAAFLDADTTTVQVSEIVTPDTFSGVALSPPAGYEELYTNAVTPSANTTWIIVLVWGYDASGFTRPADYGDISMLVDGTVVETDAVSRSATDRHRRLIVHSASLSVTSHTVSVEGRVRDTDTRADGTVWGIITIYSATVS